MWKFIFNFTHVFWLSCVVPSSLCLSHCFRINPLSLVDIAVAVSKEIQGTYMYVTTTC